MSSETVRALPLITLLSATGLILAAALPTANAQTTPVQGFDFNITKNTPDPLKILEGNHDDLGFHIVLSNDITSTYEITGFQVMSVDLVDGEAQDQITDASQFKTPKLPFKIRNFVNFDITQRINTEDLVDVEPDDKNDDDMGEWAVISRMYYTYHQRCRRTPGIWLARQHRPDDAARADHGEPSEDGDHSGGDR